MDGSARRATLLCEAYFLLLLPQKFIVSFPKESNNKFENLLNLLTIKLAMSSPSIKDTHESEACKRFLSANGKKPLLARGSQLATILLK